MPLQADLRHVIYALSDALDLVGVDDVGHGKRVGAMTAACGRLSGLAEGEVTGLFDLGMLHDLGVSSTRVHAHLVEEFDWAGSQEHCQAGRDLLAGFRPLASMAEPVACHHTRWDALERMDLDPKVAWQANLVLLVDRVDALMAPHYGSREIFARAREVQAQIKARSGTYFAPRLVELFLDASQPEAFWLLLEPRAIQVSLQDLLAQGRPYHATVPEVMGLARIFARIVDAKSPFTAEHSRGVAGLARFLGEQAGLGQETCEKLEIAGLLHDLGKLRVPDEILDKPNRLDEVERQVINTHSFETYQILRRIQGFEEITLWASYHHEEPGGRGYPFHLDADRLPLEARIMRVADIFQAMVQDRPYRHGLATDEVMAFLERLAAQGRLDDKVLALATASLDEAMRVARG